ncbi:MAG: HEAT repeat domain-containing protein [Cyanobacteria bacterium J06588_5]
MAKSRRLEAELEKIKSIQRLDSLTEDDVASLQKIIRGKQPVAIPPATNLIVRHELTQLIPDMHSAFERMLTDGANKDPSCKAKWAIANTLYRLEKTGERPNADLFLSGIRHTQPEPVWGKTIDTAPPLRALCALGLVQANYPNVLIELADLLADPEHDARAGAARAVGYSQNPAGIPLLRLKMHIGDREPQVISECCIALLALSPQQAPLVINALNTGSEAVQELAAIALGEAKIPEALVAIKDKWKRTRDGDLRASFLLAIATLRTEDAMDFLLGLVERGNLQDAKDSLSALHIYRNTTDIWQQINKTVQIRGEAVLIEFINNT